MDENLSIVFYWGPRPQTLASCAADAWTFIGNLKKFNSAFGSWSNVGVIPPVKIRSVKALSVGLGNGLNRDDIEGRVIDEVGYSITLSTARAPSIGAVLTLDMNVTSNWVFNLCLLEIPANFISELRYPDDLLRLSRLIVSSFDPEEGRIVTPAYDKAIDNYPPDPMVGVITYCKSADVYRQPLPSRLDVIDEPSGGAFAVVRDCNLTKTDPNVVKTLKQFRKTVIARTSKKLS